jgi:hypothetical protein
MASYVYLAHKPRYKSRKGGSLLRVTGSKPTLMGVSLLCQIWVAGALCCVIAMGQVLGSAAGKIDKANDALYTEAIACFKTIQLLSDWGIDNVEVESDASMLIKAVTCTDLDLSVNGILFKEIRAFCLAKFTSISFSFSPRAYNMVANALTMHGAKLEYNPQAVWPGYAPGFAHVLVASDQAVLSG